MHAPAPHTRHSPAGTMSRGLTILLAVASGLIAANVYYAQPLAGPIGAALGMPSGATGLIVTLTQIGYGAGLLLVVPLGDLIENRRLVLGVMAIGALALLGAALSSHPAPFLAASLLIGLGSVAVQILVPYAAHLAPEAIRGRVVGNVMSGLALGIVLARPVASLITAWSSWPVVFVLSAVTMVVLAVVLSINLPQRFPETRLSYRELLASMGRLVMTTPVLRRRALYQACLFASFSLFWTVTPLLLGGPDFHLSQTGIGLFALAGGAGVIAAPIAGRLADRGWSRPATALAMASAIAAFVLTWVGATGSPISLALLVVAAIALDFGMAANLVIGQRAIFALGAALRSRLNGIYMATFFVGGAIGSALGGWAFAYGGWALASGIGIAFPIAALLYFSTER